MSLPLVHCVTGLRLLYLDADLRRAIRAPSFRESIHTLPMKPFRTLAQTRTPDGSQLTLQEHDSEHYLKLNGRQLMSTTATTSELLLAELACKPLTRNSNARILIGGLGLG